VERGATFDAPFPLCYYTIRVNDHTHVQVLLQDESVIVDEAKARGLEYNPTCASFAGARQVFEQAIAERAQVQVLFWFPKFVVSVSRLDQ
jgi:hypothetical protein